MTPSLVDAVGALLREVAADVVMPRFASLAPDDIELKAPGDPVTVADREAEIRIADALLKLLPGSRVVGEEACAKNPALIENIDQGQVWIVDPIDGTGNFAAGRAPFAMMVAMLVEGEVTGSWILDPQSGRLAVAELGGGSWIEGERLRTNAAAVPSSELEGIVSEAFLPPDRRGIVDRLRREVGAVHPTARCAGFEYPLVALGGRHFALYWRTLAWDHAPGALLLREAGGSVSHLDGSPYHPAHPRPGLLLSHNPLISRDLLAIIADDN